jgi:hypothetical protein
MITFRKIPVLWKMLILQDSILKDSAATVECQFLFVYVVVDGSVVGTPTRGRLHVRFGVRFGVRYAAKGVPQANFFPENRTQTVVLMGR